MTTVILQKSECERLIVPETTGGIVATPPAAIINKNRQAERSLSREPTVSLWTLPAALYARHGYPDELRQQAVQLSSDGMNYRRIGRQLGVDHVTVMLAA
jgi:hypothetical protein